MTIRRLAAAVIPAVLAVAPTAPAHGPVDPHVRVLVDGLEPARPEIRVVASYGLSGLPPLMTLRNDGAAEVVVLASRGEPLFRIGSSGVFGNVRSASYRDATDPQRALPTPKPKPGSGLDWRLLANDPVFRWYEDRAGFHGRIPTTVAKRATTQDLVQWRVPILVAGRAATIRGRVIWRPILGSIWARVVSTSWKDERIRVRVLPGRVPGLEIKNDSPRTLEVTGRNDQPFARVGPAGVEVNLSSVTYTDTRGVGEPTGDGPRWKHQQDLPVLVWLERRAAYEAQDPPEFIERRAKETVLLRWEIPVLLDGSREFISGETYWAPIDQKRASRTPVLAGVLAALFFAGAAMTIRARRAARRAARRGEASSSG